MSKEAAVVDRFPEINALLDECVAEVAGNVAKMVKNQKRIAADKTANTFSTISDAQVKSLAMEALNARPIDLREKLAASIVAAITPEMRK